MHVGAESCCTGAAVVPGNNRLVPMANDQSIKLEYNAHFLSGLPEEYLLVRMAH